MRGKLLFSGILLAAAALSGCSTSGSPGFLGANYGARTDAGYNLPSIPTGKVPLKYQRQSVDYKSKEKPGTIIVDTGARQLYFVMAGGKAMRYGIGVGKQGFEWRGTARIGDIPDAAAQTEHQAEIAGEQPLPEVAGFDAR